MRTNEQIKRIPPIPPWSARAQRRRALGRKCVCVEFVRTPCSSIPPLRGRTRPTSSAMLRLGAGAQVHIYIDEIV